jgi:hypothetical protein
MPLFAYFSVVGSALIGLLFLWDAMTPPREPMKIASEFQGLSSMRAQASVASRAPALVAAPEPDMSSPAIKLAATDARSSDTRPADTRAAETPPAKPQSAGLNLEPINERGTSFDVGAKKRKPVARKRPAREAYAQGDDGSWDRSWERSDRSWNRSWDRSWDRGNSWSGDRYNRGYGGYGGYGDYRFGERRSEFRYRERF